MEQKLVKFLNYLSFSDLTSEQWDKFISIWYERDPDEDVFIEDTLNIRDFLETIIRNSLADKFDEIEGNKDKLSLAHVYSFTDELPENTDSEIKALWKKAQDDYFSVFPEY